MEKFVIHKDSAEKAKPKGTYRYRDDPLRVVYYPDKEKRIIYPLAAGTATDIPYKKKSKK
jgi:mRNA-degrading endonuclease RelE of RelBE toxin-antitoxin system